MNPFGRYFVYILASRKYGPIYVGVTGNLIARTYIHREDILDGFSSRYKTHLLVFYEQHGDPIEAITREKRIKKWLRPWKIRLIEETIRSGGTFTPICWDRPATEIPAFAGMTRWLCWVWGSPLTHP
jgi:putative endonuclease